MSENNYVNDNQQPGSSNANNNKSESETAEVDQQLSISSSATNSDEVVNNTIEKPKKKEHKQPQIYVFNLKNIQSVDNLNENIDNLILNSDGFGTINGNIVIKKITRSSSPKNESCDHCAHKHRQMCCIHKTDKVDEFIQYSNFIRDLDNNNKNYITIFNDEEEDWLTGNVSPNHYPKYANGDPEFLENITPNKEIEIKENQEEFNIKKWIDNYTKFFNARQQQRKKALQQQKDLLEQQRLFQQREQDYIQEQRRIQQRQRELLHQKQQELLEQIYLQPIQNTDFVAMINGQDRVPTSIQHQVHLQHLYQNRHMQEEQRKLRQQQIEDEEYECYYRRMHNFFDSLANNPPPGAMLQQRQQQQKFEVLKEKQGTTTDNKIREELVKLAIMHNNNIQNAECMQNTELQFNELPNQQNMPQNEELEQNTDQNNNNILLQEPIPEEPLCQPLDNKINSQQLNPQNGIEPQLNQLIASAQDLNIDVGISQQLQLLVPQNHQQLEHRQTNQFCQSTQQNQQQQLTQQRNSQEQYKYHHNHPNYSQQNIQEELARIHDLMTLSQQIEEKLIIKRQEKMKAEELIMKRKQQLRSNFLQSRQKQEDKK